MSIENYCIPVNFIPSLSEQSCQEIISWFRSNQRKFNSFYHEDGIVIKGTKKMVTGFASYPLMNTIEDYEFACKILHSNNINLNYKDLRFVIQRSIKSIPPHTDPGRTVSLIYNILGEAQTEFYTLKNFVPNVDYTNLPIRVDATYTMKLNHWYLFNNSSIHGVENIPAMLRLAYVINLTDKFKDFDDARKNLKSIFL